MGLVGGDVAAEVHQRLDRFRDERGCLRGVRERVRARLQRARAGARGIDLGLDDDGVAVVDRAEDGDRAAVALRMTHEELLSGGGLGRAHPRSASSAACPTVSRSRKPSSVLTSLPPLVKSSTVGARSTTPSLRVSASATRPCSSTLSGTNPAPTAEAPAAASSRDIASILPPVPQRETTTTL